MLIPVCIVSILSQFHYNVQNNRFFHIFLRLISTQHSDDLAGGDDTGRPRVGIEHKDGVHVMLHHQGDDLRFLHRDNLDPKHRVWGGGSLPLG